MSGPYTIVAVSGLMGSGKTTLARALATRFGWAYVPETLLATRYLGDLFQDPRRWAFETQLAFLTHKAIHIRNAVSNSQSIFLDRSLEEDCQIFATYFHKTGHIDDRAFATYIALAEYLSTELPTPSLILYCKCSISTAQLRIQARGRDYQALYPPSHLQDIDALYMQWLQTVPCPVCTLDSDHIDWRSDTIVDAIADEVDTLLSRLRTDEHQLELFPLDQRRNIGGALQYISSHDPLLTKAQSGPHTTRRRRPATGRGRFPLVYVAAPFTGRAEVQTSQPRSALLFGLEPSHGRILPGRYRRMLTRLCGSLERLGLATLLPHRDINKWGKRVLSSSEVMDLCQKAVSTCDCFVGILGESHGAHCEFGIALGMGKPCLIIKCDEMPESFIAAGVSSSDGVMVVHCSAMSDVSKVVLSHEVQDFLGTYIPINRGGRL